MHAIFNFRETISLIAVPLLLLPLPLAIQTEPAVCAYTILIVVGYWVTHAVPLATTALVPTMIMPLFGVVNAKTLCKLYMQETNFLAFSCLLLTIAIEKWNLHRRVALRVLTLVGVTPRRLLTFFMTMTAIISIFISNTATASLIIPFVHGVLITLDDDISRRYNIKLDDKGNIVGKYLSGGTTPNWTTRATSWDNIKLDDKGNIVDVGTVDDIVEESDTRLTDHIQTHARNLVRMNKALRLCVPLAATLSGMASLAGTPTNDALYNYVSKNYGKTKLNYNNWLICTLPLTIILLLFAWIWLIVLFLGFRLVG
ncbi:Solute carrier family 13 member 5 [Lamellibrachia satsuma]|nr:Solute carrier family 13 member 5 [Lamellibrachia satsuma]